VLAAVEARLRSGQYAVGGGGSLAPDLRRSPLLGLRVRTSSCAVSAVTALFAPSVQAAADSSSSSAAGSSSSTSGGEQVQLKPGEQQQQQEQQEQQQEQQEQEQEGGSDGRSASAVRLAKCLGTITDYCPGNDEHFVVFDNSAVIAPKWIRVEAARPASRREGEEGGGEEGGGEEEEREEEEEESRRERDRLLVERDIAGRPNDVELLFEWTFPEDSDPADPEQQGQGQGQGLSGEVATEEGGRGREAALLCGLCGLGDFEDEEGAAEAGLGLGLGAVVTCSVCRDHHFHRHCMPMGRVALAENQNWRCWHCACE
jgi:hypothetical protein